MPYFCLEGHFRWFVGILWREFDVYLEESSLIWSVFWSLDVTFPISEVVVEQFYFYT